MRLQRFVFIFILLLFSFFIWKFLIFKLCKTNVLKTKIYYDTTYNKLHVNKINNIHVKTDVIDLKINLNGGFIYQGKLLNYQDKLQDFKKLKLLNSMHNLKQIDSGIIETNKYNINYKKKIIYNSNRSYFSLLNGQKILFVSIKSKIQNGIYFIKTFIFKKGCYDIEIEYKIYNHNLNTLSYHIFGELQQNYLNNNSNNLNVKNNQFDNIAYSQDNQKYKKFFFHECINKKLHIISKKGWISFFKKYFSIAWILDASDNNTIYLTQNNQNIILGYKSSNFFVFPETKKIKRIAFWFGPKIQNKMSSFAPYFDEIIDYGWFWFISKPLFHFLNLLYYFFNNWGCAIIIITCIIRMMTYPLIKSQYISTIKMKILQPEINKIKDQFKNNNKKLNEKIVQLYKKNNLNPFNGLISVILQMPIFFALYYVLINSIELRHSPFIFWINDLSAQDPFYVLPILMGITVFFMQKTSPANNFPLSLKEKIINFIPMLFIVCFLWFPSGLVLYYTFSNLVTILQQIIINYNLKNNFKK